MWGVIAAATSYLPALPAVPLPTRLQQRLVAFILRRTLGGFLRGGLDEDRVEADVRNGRFTVRGVQVDEQAINSLLSPSTSSDEIAAPAAGALPLSFESGTVGCITAVVAWPLAKLDLAVDEVELVFRVTRPRPPDAPSLSSSFATERTHSRSSSFSTTASTAAESPPPVLDLADSHVSLALAHDFVSHALTPAEDAELRASLHLSPSASTSVDLPGAFGGARREAGEGTGENDAEVVETTMLAGVVERILARLEVKVRSVRVRLRWEAGEAQEMGEHELELRVDEIVCKGDAGAGEFAVPADHTRTSEQVQTRSLTVTPPRLYLRLAAPDQPPPPSTAAPSLSSYTRRGTESGYASSSSEDSDSSTDEHDLLAMSQSIADLRTSFHSAASSSARDMFASARSGGAFSAVVEEREEEAREAAAGGRDDPFVDPDEAFVTPQASPARRDEQPLPAGSPAPEGTVDDAQLIVSLGSPDSVTPLGFYLISSLPPSTQTAVSPPTATSRPPLSALRLKPELTLRADLLEPWIVALSAAQLAAIAALAGQLAAPPETANPHSTSTTAAPSTGLPLNVDLRLAALSLVILLPSSNAPLSQSDLFTTSSAPLKAPHLRIRLEDLALRASKRNALGGLEVSLGHLTLSETASSPTAHGGWRTLPILVDDLALTPSPGGIDTVDWVRAASAARGGVATKDWRRSTKNAKGVPRTSGPAAQADAPAVRARLGGAGGTSVELAPLHLCVDLAMAARLLPLVDEVAAAVSNLSPSAAAPPPRQRKTSTTSTASTPRPLSPVFTSPSLPLHVLDDLSAAPSRTRSTPPALSISCPLLRISLRCPAPRKERLVAQDPDQLRSGILTLDLVGPSLSLKRAGEARLDFESLDARFAPASTLNPSSGPARASAFARLAPLVPRSEDASAALPSLAFSTRGSWPVLDVVVPLVSARIDKPTLDGLQLLADDVAQFCESELGAAAADEEADEEGKGDERIIGSRYFGAKSFMGRRKSGRRGAGRDSETESTASGATARAWEGAEERARGGTGGERKKAVIRAEVTDVVVELVVDQLNPIASAPRSRRHLKLLASDLSADVEMLVEAEDDVRVKLGIADVRFEDITKQNKDVPPVVILSRTLPRNLANPSAPLVKLSLSSSVEQETSLKESKIQIALSNLTYYATADIAWLEELGVFAKAPAGAFEHVVPNELTRIRLRLSSLSLHVSAPTRPSHIVLHVSEAKARTDLMPDLPRTTLSAEVAGLRALAADSDADVVEPDGLATSGEEAWRYWRTKGFAQILLLERASLQAKQGNGLILPDLELLVDDAKAQVSLCADTVSSLAAFAADFAAAPAFHAREATGQSKKIRRPPPRTRSRDLLASLDPAAFERAAPINDLPEILDDDVPANIAYLADALNQTNLRPSHGRSGSLASKSEGELISDVDGETIRMFAPGGLQIVDEYLAEPRVDDTDYTAPASRIRCRLRNADVSVHLHEGYDWSATRKAIEEEAKAVRRRLEKIRQLLASGQAPDATAENASVLMFGSVQLGLPPGTSELPPKELLAAINEELDDTPDSDVVSTAASSWSTVPGGGGKAKSTRASAPAVVGKSRKRLTRSKAFAIEVNLRGLDASFDAYSTDASLAASITTASGREQLASRIKADVAALDIIDNIKTSTWHKFLTELRPNDGGTVRPTGAPMAKVEMSSVKPIGRVAEAQEEVLLKIKVSPLRLYVDQDALDFLKAFGAFELPKAAQPPASATASSAPSQETFYQRVEVLPVKLKLDYKPKRVDYNALRSGKTAELMNFFHFDGSEMTLRHLIVTGISGTSTLSSLVQDIWTPDVKAHQLADVVSGIAPVRSVVNVGAGVANLVLLPIEQYRKDGRVVRGLQKGAQAFAKQTTLEAINVGARLATGTQVILEQAEHVLGARFGEPIAAEAIAVGEGSAATGAGEGDDGLSDEERREVRSRYAEQPADLRQGMQSAYKSLGDNFKEAAQTILAVPMEVYERSGTEGPVRSVVRAVPVAVLKPMIGASGAVSKALLGLRNSLDPDAQRGELEDKYKPSTSRS
ncbi:Atg2p [Rhodotorula paludigena]|uniref:Atg2p n=1 Tax=Rhodotorula paludigena TaxID=86838 RepID=UPI0031715E8C